VQARDSIDACWKEAGISDGNALTAGRNTGWYTEKCLDLPGRTSDHRLGPDLLGIDGWGKGETDDGYGGIRPLEIYKEFSIVSRRVSGLSLCMLHGDDGQRLLFDPYGRQDEKKGHRSDAASINRLLRLYHSFIKISGGEKPRN